MLRFRFITSLFMLSWLLQPMDGAHIAPINSLHAQSQGKPLSEMASIAKQVTQEQNITPEHLGNGEKLGELLQEYEKNDDAFDNKRRLNLSKTGAPKIRHQQAAFWVITLLIFSMFAILLFYMRRYRIESKKLYDTNKKLSDINSHFESIAQDRTHDLANMLKKAQENDKLKSTFLANISHEIRTPLNGILGFTQLLSEENLCTETRKQYLDTINRKGMFLLQIINDLINISKIEAGQVEIKNESFNLNQLLYDLFSTFNSNTCHRKRDGVELKLILSLSDSDSNIVSDALRIEQILINLIDNALKFTHKGWVEFGYTLEDNNRIKFFVKDTGIGIPNDGRENIFCRFTRESMASPYNSSGTGLGLPICKGLVNLLKGDVWFDSQPDKGTKFYFSIPYLEASPNEKSYTPGLSSTFPSLNFKGKKILVVEDDLFSFQFIEALLKDTNAKIIHAKNGEDAVEISSIVTDIDLVIMDICLPFLDGCEATIQIKKQNPKICVIAQTANVHSDDRAKCMRAGCDDYIAKPLDPDEFLRLVAHYLKKAEFNRRHVSNH